MDDLKNTILRLMENLNGAYPRRMQQVDLDDLVNSHTKPANESVIQELKDQNKETCAVCLADYEIDELLLVFPKCRHAFHKECIVTWLTRSGVCPVCRSDIRTQLEVPGQDSDVVRVGGVRGPAERHEQQIPAS